MDKKKKETIVVCLGFGIVLSFILSIICMAVRTEIACDRELKSFASGRIEMEVTVAGKKYPVSSVEAGRFVAMVIAPHSVAGHHSCSKDMLDVRINSALYRLGKDSENADEYWLDRIFQDGPGSYRSEVVRHFKSMEMKQWIEGVVKSPQASSDQRPNPRINLPSNPTP